MKKILLVLFVFLIQLTYSQDYPKPELLIGKEFKVREKSSELKKYGYDGFFSDEELTIKYMKTPDIFFTPYESLVGKIFKVISFKEIERYGRKLNSLKIENSTTGIIYFDYDPNSQVELDLEIIGSIKYPENYWCNDITKEVDKFSKKVTYYTPFSGNVSFSKTGKSIYLSLETIGSTLNVREKGFTILLSNGSKISKPNAIISVDYSNGYRYSAFILLNAEEIQRIIKNPITDFKLYIYDQEVINPEKYSEYLKCLTKM